MSLGVVVLGWKGEGDANLKTGLPLSVDSVTSMTCMVTGSLFEVVGVWEWLIGGLGSSVRILGRSSGEGRMGDEGDWEVVGCGDGGVGWLVSIDSRLLDRVGE